MDWRYYSTYLCDWDVKHIRIIWCDNCQCNFRGHAFFTDAELAFFDSEDADFGEMPVLVSDPDTIISGIFDDTKDITYFSSQF